MGSDPSKGDYETGRDCGCWAHDKTPLWVCAAAWGLKKCPGAFFDPPNYTVWMEQTDFDSCRWMAMWDGNSWDWRLEAHQSTFVITWPGFFFFKSIVPHLCIETFYNQNVCGAGPVFADQGKVMVWYGPTQAPIPLFPCLPEG